MVDVILDDELKIAKIKRVKAETENIKIDIEIKKINNNNLNWQKIIQTIGAVILGLGGIIAAVTQYELAELKSKNEKNDLKIAEEKLEKNKKDIDSATKDLLKVIDKKNNAEITLNEYKEELENLNNKIIK